MSEYGRCLVEEAGNGVWVVRLEGEHDLASAGELAEAFEALAEQGRNVVVDLRDTHFIDSSVIHALCRFAARQRVASRRAVLLLGPRSPVRRTLEIAGVLGALPFTEDAGAALELASAADESSGGRPGAFAADSGG